MKTMWVLVALLLAACEPTTTEKSPPTPEPLVHLTELSTDPEDNRVGVLLHGYGSDEFDLIPLARRMGLHGPIESFVGPEPAGKGHAWFPIDFRPGGVRYSPDAADEVLGRLARALRDVRATHPDRELVVVGFSQGAMMTLLLAAEHPEVLDCGVALSGALPRRPSPPGGASPRVLMTHGRDDEVIPFERGEEAADTLKKLGVSVTFRGYENLGHGVDARVVSQVRAWLPPGRPRPGPRPGRESPRQR